MTAHVAIPVDAIPEDAIDGTPREDGGGAHDYDAATVADVSPEGVAAAAMLSAEEVARAALGRIV